MKYSEETIQKIIELHNSGKGVTEIGRILNLDRAAVSRNLKKLGYNTSRNTLIKDIFHVIDTEDKAYWLGFLYADGYISKYNQIEVSLSLEDIDHLKKLKKFVNTNTNIITDKYRCRLLFCSKEMVSDLAILGCVNNKSLILTFPTEEQVPQNLLNHFLRGYVDGDGCLCCTEKTK
jgi:DNA-binding transcriptional regulator WhiA